MPGNLKVSNWRKAQGSPGSDWLLFLHPETALEPGWDGSESFMTGR
jgi:hypothetical protein